MVGTLFYEWQRRGKEKQPYAVGLTNESPLALAGVWDRWVDRETGEMVESCAVVTTEPNAPMAGIHDRMPVMVGPDEREVWLYGTPDEACHVMRLYDPDQVEAWAVDAAVGNVRNDGPECIMPLAD